TAKRAPRQSTVPSSEAARLSGTRQNAKPSVSRAIGTLMKKIARQDRASTSQPPRTGPTAEVRAEKPAQVPIALPRSSAGKAALMIARLPGIRSAPPALCAARAAIRAAKFGANPQATEAVVK